MIAEPVIPTIAQLDYEESDSTTCEINRHHRWKRDLRILDARHIETRPSLSSNRHRFCRGFAHDYFCHPGRYCLGSWTRHYAGCVVLLLLSPHRFVPTWGSGLGESDRFSELWLPDCRRVDLGTGVSC
jgi:hypothetical protein